MHLTETKILSQGFLWFIFKVIKFSEELDRATAR